MSESKTEVHSHTSGNRNVVNTKSLKDVMNSELTWVETFESREVKILQSKKKKCSRNVQDLSFQSLNRYEDFETGPSSKGSWQSYVELRVTEFRHQQWTFTLTHVSMMLTQNLSLNS